MTDLGWLRADVRDALYMHRALELAEQGWGRVHPNPLVGAVVVADGQVVGEGHHAEFGGPHAEIVALAQAGTRAHGATLYVTLEPCAHHGKTPPCTDAIVAAGIARVVYAAADPHPDARGGAAVLEQRGVRITAGVGEDEALQQNAAFFHAIREGRCYVVLKYATSLDGKLAAAVGAATEVTRLGARAEVHRMRAGYDAILVGRSTVAIDDPLLTVRGDIEPRVPPIRVIMDTGLQTSVNARMFRDAPRVPVWLLGAEDAPSDRRLALEEVGARVFSCPRDGCGLDIDAALELLWSEGVRSIFCEGGGRLGSALLDRDRIERMFLFLAPTIFGSAGVPAFVGGAKPAGWTIRHVRHFEPDLLLTVDRVRGPGA